MQQITPELWDRVTTRIWDDSVQECPGGPCCKFPSLMTFSLVVNSSDPDNRRKNLGSTTRRGQRDLCPSLAWESRRKETWEERGAYSPQVWPCPFFPNYSTFLHFFPSRNSLSPGQDSLARGTNMFTVSRTLVGHSGRTASGSLPALDL